MGRYIKILLVIGFLGMFFKAKTSSEKKPESPLAIVVKLQSAEAFRDYSTAKKYLDVDKTYSKYAGVSKMSPEKVWRELVEFNYEMSRSMKGVINTYPYHHYHITEKNNQVNASVIFNPLTKGDRGMVYNLEFRKNQWIIIGLDSL
jgi:predicted choloylglycine hydrolase